ncbi:hypothetical protein APW76_07050, partial [Staphylococcus aureus]
VQTALENINNGVDNGDVDDALTQGKAAIDTIQVDATVKPKANQAIEAKAEDTKESIDHTLGCPVFSGVALAFEFAVASLLSVPLLVSLASGSF